MEVKIILINETDLRRIIRDEIQKVRDLMELENEKMKLLSKKEAMKMLKMGSKRLNRLITDGVLNTTPDGKISQYEIRKFIENKLNKN